MLARKYALVHRRNYDVVEVKCTGFKHTHDLESVQRFSDEVHAFSRNGSFNEMKECVLLHRYVVFCGNSCELFHRLPVTCQESVLKSMSLLVIACKLERVVDELDQGQCVVKHFTGLFQIIDRIKYCRQFGKKLSQVLCRYGKQSICIQIFFYCFTCFTGYRCQEGVGYDIFYILMEKTPFTADFLGTQVHRHDVAQQCRHGCKF